MVQLSLHEIQASSAVPLQAVVFNLLLPSPGYASSLQELLLIFSQCPSVPLLSHALRQGDLLMSPTARLDCRHLLSPVGCSCLSGHVLCQELCPELSCIWESTESLPQSTERMAG